MQESHLVQEAVIALPDQGGLVLPLAFGNFLVGLLVVERPRRDAASLSSPDEAQATADATSSNSQAEAFNARERKVLQQTARVLALSCAMELRAALERASNSVRGRQVRSVIRMHHLGCIIAVAPGASVEACQKQELFNCRSAGWYKMRGCL